MDRKKLLRVTAVFFAVMLCFTVLSRAADQGSVAVVTTARPENKMITHEVRASGKVEQNQELAVTTLPNQRVESIYVTEGDRAAKGDVLFSVDLSVLDEQILEQEQEMEKQRLTVGDAKSQKDVSAQQKASQQAQASEQYSLATRSAGIRLSRAKEALDQAKKELKKFRKKSGQESEDSSAQEVLEQTCEEKADAYIQAQQELVQVQWKIENAVSTALVNAQNGVLRAGVYNNTLQAGAYGGELTQSGEKASLVKNEEVLTQDSGEAAEDIIVEAEEVPNAAGESEIREIPCVTGETGSGKNPDAAGETGSGKIPESEAGYAAESTEIVLEDMQGAAPESAQDDDGMDIVIEEITAADGSALSGGTGENGDSGADGDNIAGTGGGMPGADGGNVSVTGGGITGSGEDNTGIIDGVTGNGEDNAGIIDGITGNGEDNTGIIDEITGSDSESSDGNGTQEGQISQAELDAIEQSVRDSYRQELTAAQQKVDDALAEKTAAQQALEAYQQERLEAGNAQDAQSEQQLIANVKAAQQEYEDAAIAANEAAVTSGRAVQQAGIPDASNSSDRMNEITYEQMELQLEKLEQLKANGGKVTAPADGLVTKINIMTGEKTTDTTAVLMADLAKGYRFTAELTKEQESYIGTGDLVTLKGGSKKQVLEELPVESVAADEENSDSYRVTVRIPQDSDVFEIGAAATLEFIKKSEAYPTCVPLSALHLDDQNQPYVLVPEQYETILGMELKARRVSVTVLEKNESYAALAEGAVTSQQEVIISSDKAVDKGSRVRVE